MQHTEERAGWTYQRGCLGCRRDVEIERRWLSDSEADSRAMPDEGCLLHINKTYPQAFFRVCKNSTFIRVLK